MDGVLDFDRFDALIDSHAEEAFRFLEDLVRVDSTIGREQAALDMLASQFAACGFEIDRVDVPADIGADPAAGIPQVPYDGRYDVIASLPRRGGPSLLFNGHIDVVPPGDLTQWTSPPFEPVRRDGWLFGRGSGDMKAGFAMGWLALNAVQQVDPGLIRGDLALLAVIEEECTGNGTLAACRAGHLADAVVLLEPTDLDVLVAGVGVLWFEIVVRGSAGHAYAADRSASALDAALELVAGLKDLERRINADVDDHAVVGVSQPYNLNIGEVRAGDWQSSVPSSATLGVRFGFPRAWTIDDAVECVQHGDRRDRLDVRGADCAPPDRAHERLSSRRLRDRCRAPARARRSPPPTWKRTARRQHRTASGRRPTPATTSTSTPSPPCATALAPSTSTASTSVSNCNRSSTGRGR